MIDYIEPTVWRWTIESERDARLRESLRNPQHAVRCEPEHSGSGWMHGFFAHDKEPRSVVTTLD